MGRFENHWSAGLAQRQWRAPWLAVLVAAVSVTPTLPAEESFLRDAQHTLLARNVLERDPQLSPLNLGVRVHNRIATLWGPVPEVALGVKAADLLRQQPEFRAVNNDLYFEDDFSYLQSRGRDFLPRLPTASPTPELQPAANVSLLPPVKIESTPPSRPTSSPGTLTTRPMDVKKPPVAYLPGKTGNEESKPQDPPPAAKPDATEAPLVQALRTLQESQVRFRELQFEVHDGVVTLSGPSQRAEALYEMARAVSQVTGVVRVLVREN